MHSIIQLLFIDGRKFCTRIIFALFKKEQKLSQSEISADSHLRFVVQSFLISYENPPRTFAYLQKRNIHEWRNGKDEAGTFRYYRYIHFPIVFMYELSYA